MTKQAQITAFVGDIVEGTSNKTGKAYRFQSLTVMQKGRNHNDTYFLREGEDELAAGKYDFDVTFGSGPDGKTRIYYSNPVAAE